MNRDGFKILHSVVPVWGYRFVLVISQLVLIPILVSYLGVFQYSIFVMLTVISNFTSILDFGLGSSLQIKYAECGDDESKRATLDGLSILILSLAALISVIMAMVSAPMASHFFHINCAGLWGYSKNILLGLILAAAALSFVFSAYSKILIGRSLIAHSFAIQSISLISGMTVVLMGIILFKVRIGAELFLLRIVTIGIANAIALAWTLRGAVFSLPEIRNSFPIIRIGGKFMIFNFISVLISGLPYKFISSFLVGQDIIKYNILDRIFGVILQFSQSPLASLTPRFTMAFMQRKKDSFDDFLREYLKFSLILVCCSVVFLFFSKGFIIKFLGAGKLGDIGWEAILAYSFLTISNLWISFYSTALQAGGRLAALIVFSPIQIGFLILISGFLVQRFGLVGAIGAIIISNLLFPALILPIALKRALKYQ